MKAMSNDPQKAWALPSLEALFRSFESPRLTLKNRFVMAAMGRLFARNGVIDHGYAPYYRRRAEGGCALIISEATAIAHPASGSMPTGSSFAGEAALAAWKHVVDEVHAGGARFVPQLWHAGLLRPAGPYADPALTPPNPEIPPLGPSGLYMDNETPGQEIKPPRAVAEPMTQRQIDDVVAAYGESAAAAQRIGCDGIEIHGAHGYLIDQFFWDRLNRRSDHYNGDLVARTRFACEVIRECRRRVGSGFPILFRYSQWKQQQYDAKLATTPQELERFLAPMVDAGVDVFDCSTRRFWEPEFPGSHLNLAGWTKKLSGLPTIMVGSVGLTKEVAPEEELESLRAVARGAAPGQELITEQGIIEPPPRLDEIVERLECGECDLVAIGRALITNPAWPELIRAGKIQSLRPYRTEALMTLE